MFGPQESFGLWVVQLCVGIYLYLWRLQQVQWSGKFPDNDGGPTHAHKISSQTRSSTTSTTTGDIPERKPNQRRAFNIKTDR